MRADDLSADRPDRPERPQGRKGARGGSGRAQRRGFRFRRAHRLLERRDFDRVLGGGRRRSSPELIVVTTAPGRRGRLQECGLPEGFVASRLGITVGRKAGSSVERNRFKRRVREWFRRQQGTLEAPLDIVVIARRGAVGLGFDELSRLLARLLPRSISQVSENTEEIS